MIRDANAVTNPRSVSLQLGLILSVLFVISFYNYLLFHTLAEFIVAVVSAMIFFVIWNTRRYLSNGFFIVIGPAFLFVAIFTLLHALAYKGMSIFSPFNDPDLATQLWLVLRFLVAGSFLTALLFSGKRIKMSLVLAIYFFIFAALILTLFPWNIFPHAYIQGIGLTPFKKYSEYIISLIFLVSIVVFYFKKSEFDKIVWQLIFWFFISSIATELIFTLYLSVYDYFNLVGHLLSIVGIYLVYLAVVDNSLTKPYKLLYESFKKEQEALYKSEERFRSAVDNYPAVFVIYDMNRKMQYINSKGLKEGLSLKNSKLTKQMHIFKDYDTYLPALEKAIETKTKQSHELELDTEEGKKFFTMTYVPILDRAGEVKEVIGIGNDVTKYVESENNLKLYANDLEKITDNLQRFQQALENASDHIVMTDARGYIIYANKAAENLTGYTKAEMMGKTIALWENSLINDYGSAEFFFSDIMDKIKKTSHFFVSEMSNVRKNREIYLTDLHISPVVDDDNGEIKFFILIERDITRLKEIDLAKSEFISTASHQLRTPLTSISLSSELLLRGIAGEVDQNQKKYLEEIFISTQKMAELIDDLLSVTKIEMGSFEVRQQEVELIEFVDRALDELKLQVEKKGLLLVKDYNLNSKISINFDKNVLRMSIENLVTNAIQYTPVGGIITIGIKKNIDGVLIEIADTGIGVDKEDQEKIFSKLFRSEMAKEVNSNGSGLGLYIVKSFIDKAGAKILVDSEEGKGTVFSILIPETIKK